MEMAFHQAMLVIVVFSLLILLSFKIILCIYIFSFRFCYLVKNAVLVCVIVHVHFHIMQLPISSQHKSRGVESVLTAELLQSGRLQHFLKHSRIIPTYTLSSSRALSPTSHWAQGLMLQTQEHKLNSECAIHRSDATKVVLPNQSLMDGWN